MNIYIVIKDRVAEVLSDRGRKPLLVCGNLDNRIIFTFDEEWKDKGKKIARFVYRTCNGHGSTVCCDVPIMGNSVTVPFFQNISELWVGVIAEGEMVTSATRITCIPSISGVSDDACEETEAITVTELSFENGDYVVTSKTGKPIRSVTIKKPTTLISQNIREGITVAGITGTCNSSDNIPPAPVIMLDGDILNIEYDGEATSFILPVFNGVGKGTITADAEGSTQIDIKKWLSGEEAGTYKIAVEAYGIGGVKSISNEVSYTFDGTVDDADKTYVVALGGQAIEISYKIGTDDLSDYVERWDEIEPDGTVTTPNSFTGLTDRDHVLLYLPEGTIVSEYKDCEIQTYEDPRFIQLYNFKEGFAIVNFVSEDQEPGGDEDEPDVVETISFSVNGKTFSVPSGWTWEDWFNDGSIPDEFDVGYEDYVTYNGFDVVYEPDGAEHYRNEIRDNILYYVDHMEDFWCSRCGCQVGADDHNEFYNGYFVLCYGCSDHLDDPENCPDPLGEGKNFSLSLKGSHNFVRYLTGTSSLKSSVENWALLDDLGDVASLGDSGLIQNLSRQSHVLLRLPTSLEVVGFSNCSVHVYYDSRFIEVYDFIGNAVINLDYSDNFVSVEPSLSFSGTNLVISGSKDSVTEYKIYWSTDPIYSFHLATSVSSEGGFTRVDISEYLQSTDTYFKVYAYCDSADVSIISDAICYRNLIPAPVITLEGDMLNIEYDASTTNILQLYVNGSAFDAYDRETLDPNSTGVIRINVKQAFSGLNAGAYAIAVNAIGREFMTSMSNEASYTFDGTVDDADKTYVVALGGQAIEISYKIGTDDLSDYVERWDEIEPDGTVTTPNSFTGLTDRDHVLLYLPEGTIVSEYKDCEIQTYEDPRFIQLYNFKEGFAIVNFVA